MVAGKKNIWKGAIHAGMASSFVLACATVGALGLGEISGDAQIGRPLDSKIDIVGENADFDIDLVQVRRVRSEDAESYGFELVGPYFPLTLNIKENKGDAFVEVTSQKPLNEPFLEFLVELYWPTGNVIRQYLVLPTQPILADNSDKPFYRWQDETKAPDTQTSERLTSNQDSGLAEPTAAASGPVRNDSAPRRSGPIINPGDTSYTVVYGDLLSTIARNWGRTTGQSSARLTRAVTRWLIENNPNAFPNGNPNDLEVGVNLVLPPNIELSPIRSGAVAPATATVIQETDNNPLSATKVVLQSDPLAITELMTEVTSLRAQVEIAEQEIGRLKRENGSFRRRIQSLESAQFEQQLIRGSASQQNKLDRVKQQQEADAENRALPSSRRSEETGTVAPVKPTEPTAKAQPNSDKPAAVPTQVDDKTKIPTWEQVVGYVESSKWLVLGGGAISLLIGLLLYRRQRDTDDDRFEPTLASQVPEPDVDEPVKPAVTTQASAVEPLLPAAAESKVEADEFDAEPMSVLEQEEAIDSIDIALPEVAVEPEPEEDLGDESSDWMDRKFGSAELEADQDHSQLVEASEVVPYSEDKLDLMPWAGEEEVPQFELDEELLENLAEEMGEIEGDALPQGEVEEVEPDLDQFPSTVASFEKAPADLGEDDSEENDEDESDQGLISEIEMYLQLGQQDKASRLLSQLLDDVSIDQNDPRIQSLVEQCLPKQA